MLLPFVIFAVLMVITLLIALYLLYPGSQKISTIPGLDPSTEVDGNIPDISKAGSMTEFLIKLHKDFGSIASFWIGREFIVSISSPELFKEVSHVFDRPASLYTSFEPLLGKQSIQYANGQEGKERRKLQDRSFTQQKLVHQFPMMQKVCEELCSKWSGMTGSDEHIPLSLHVSALVMKTLTRFAFGDYFKDEAAIMKFREDYDLCFWIMENTLVDGPMVKGSENEKKFKAGIKRMRKIVSDIIKQRENAEIAPEDKIFIDSMLECYDNEDKIFDDCMTYLIGGSHTTTFLLVWAIYFLATHPEMQEKVYKDVRQHYKGGAVTVESMKLMKYTLNFMNESMRYSKIAPFAARVSSHDSVLGGHKVLKNTPVITSIGTIFEDEEIYKNPKEFNPDRFDERLPAYSFEPFGFAGKRKCPGYRMTELEAQMLVVLIVSKFKVSLVPGQLVECKYGLVTKPADEIWITVEKRK